MQTGDGTVKRLRHFSEVPDMPCPAWLRDAKLGIYFHWGVYSVPAFKTEWYGRWMYWERHAVNRYHKEHYGDPRVHGYHEFVEQFRAEQFDAEEWAQLFAEAGARFAGPVAEHHDGFAMWDSDLTPWNAMDRGPRRDIVGEMETAIRARGMKFVATFHHERQLQRYRETYREEVPKMTSPERPVWYKAFYNSHFPYVPGTAPASDDPELRLMYGNLPEAEWLETQWFGKLKEVILKYRPDMIWFDLWLNLIPEACRATFCEFYREQAGAWGRDVVIIHKNQDLPARLSVEDFEKGRLDHLAERAWLTDDTVGTTTWGYTQGMEIKPFARILHPFLDIVSKNGQLLLNISPMADGTIPEQQKTRLRELGAWLKVNGEGIYGSRPWRVYGEGPTRLAAAGHYIKEVDYTPQDIRFTQSADGGTLYAFALGWPGAGAQLRIRALGAETCGMAVRDVALLGHERGLAWSQEPEALVIHVPADATQQAALGFRIKDAR